jgi:gas vesicle protein
MTERGNSDVWTAVAIGAIVGIGATLLVRARQDDDAHEIVKRLRPVTKHAKNAARSASKQLGRSARRAGKSGEELLSAGHDIMDELRKGAREIVHATRDELRKATRDSVREVQRAARRAARTVR